MFMWLDTLTFQQNYKLAHFAESNTCSRNFDAAYDICQEDRCLLSIVCRD